MIQESKTVAELVLGWVDLADEDLGAGKHLLDQGELFLNAVAAHAQQAAEKYIKGYLTWKQKYFPKSHDLEILLKLVAEVDPQIASDLSEAGKLTAFIVTAWYADDISAISFTNAKEAVALAKKTQTVILSALPPEITLRRRIS